MSTTPHLDDERLSAWLDGEADADEVGHVDSCAECASRVTAWRDASRLVATSPPLASAAQRQAAVGAALAAAAAGVPRAPLPLADRRRRRAAFFAPRVAAAAAAVIVIAGITVAVARTGGGGSGHASTAAGSAQPAATGRLGPPATGGPSASPPVAGAVPGTSASRVALGRYQDQAQLVAALRAQLLSPNRAAAGVGQPSSDRPFQPCLTKAAGAAKVSSRSIPVLEATLDYRGSPAQVFVFEVAGRHVAAVLGVPGCGLVAALTF